VGEVAQEGVWDEITAKSSSIDRGLKASGSRQIDEHKDVEPKTWALARHDAKWAKSIARNPKAVAWTNT